MKYGSVCSGIEAATVAWHPLGWEPAFFSEIDKFPRAVLRHHYPGVPLHGDFTTIEADQYGSIDVLVGGTPCQSFSVAGLRGGMDDNRGNLALEYIRLADRKRARWVAWENVPGIFSSNGGEDFRCFLSGLVRWSVPHPGDGGWAKGGVIAPGPVDGAYGVAWRVLNAQYFGVAQRRRRVFVVGYLGDWRPAAAVLLERESLQGNPPPGRGTGKEDAGTLEAGAGKHCGSGVNPELLVPEAIDVENGLAPHGSLQMHPTAPPIKASEQHGHTLVHCPAVANPLTARMHKGINTTLDEGQTPIAIHGTQDPDQLENQAHTLGQNYGQENAIAFAQNQRGEVTTGDVVPPLSTGGGKPGEGNPAIAFKPGQSEAAGGTFVTEEYTPTLQGQNNGSTAVPAVAFKPSHYTRGKDGASSEITPPLSADADKGDQEAVIAFNTSGYGASVGEIASTMQASYDRLSNQIYGAIDSLMQVRRLTPVECERLQGFPDNYTLIPTDRAKKIERDMFIYLRAYRPDLTMDEARRLAKDGPRYKALGNSMAVPVMRWIGERIQQVDRIVTEHKTIESLADLNCGGKRSSA